MSTKAQRLELLRNSVIGKSFLPLCIIRSNDLDSLNISNFFLNIISQIGPGPYAVRSSSFDEDQEHSNAGKYLSLLDVTQDKLIDSIREVFNSYETTDEVQEVFVQPYISNSEASGVLFTVDPSTNSNYFVINFSKGNDTQQITSGSENGHVIVTHNSEALRINPTEFKWIQPLIQLSEVCSSILRDESLDIEFAILNGIPIILQVRHLHLHGELGLDQNEQTEAINEIQLKISELQEVNPFLVGNTTVLGVMPDWNPAELIGIRPNPLALSLFKELITDNIWAYERTNLGYRNVRSFPLLVDLAGHPFIDFRTSVNSLLPSSLEREVAEKIANLYIDRLSNNPALHDKVEFEVVISCFTFDFDQKISVYKNYLSENEIEVFRSALVTLTKNMILNNPYGIDSMLSKHQELIPRFNSIQTSDMNELNKIYWLIEDCKRYGTLPFGGVARAAFVATAILGSIVKAGVITEEELRMFYENINTAASALLPDLGKLDRDTFINKYGHLRPGTFDITTPSYQEEFDLYFPNQEVRFDETVSYSADINTILISRIEESKILNELSIGASAFINFCIKSIAGRESVKFNFSRNISLVLDLITKIGLEHGFSKKDMSFTQIQFFLSAYRESHSLRTQLIQQINLGKKIHKASRGIWLPPIICQPRDAAFFEMPKLLPNFITTNSVTAEGILVSAPEDDLSGKIVLIESADPGFDWIFTRGILGIVTCYGGVNSHMAVRSKEVNIPAAIGVGEDLFSKLSLSTVIRLDCSSKMIEAVR